MSTTCSHDCSTCGEDCSSRIEKLPKNSEKSKIKKLIAVVSGKGGVGKSSVSSLLAVIAKKKGFSSAVLDADVTGPSVPRLFGANVLASAVGDGILPVVTKSGIEIMSINLLLENETDPVVWRGPVLSGTVQQFFTDVYWGDVDYMFVDMPPGTGDVPLTVFQSLPVDGIIIVTSPQQLVGVIVEKAVKMANLMKVPVLAVVENMAYFDCPDCGKRFYPYGKGDVEKFAKQNKIKCFCSLPLDGGFAEKCDEGNVELADTTLLEKVFEAVK